MTPYEFRTEFPEFANTQVYPDAMVLAWITVATSFVNPLRWQELACLGIQLVAAHYLAIGARDQSAAVTGAIPGQMTGPTASKSVDKVSVSYDTGTATLDNAGFWALTSYGIRYLSLARLMGAGPLQM